MFFKGKNEVFHQETRMPLKQNQIPTLQCHHETSEIRLNKVAC